MRAFHAFLGLAFLAMGSFLLTADMRFAAVAVGVELVAVAWIALLGVAALIISTLFGAAAIRP